MFKLFNTLYVKGQFSIIETNVNMTRQVQGKNAFKLLSTRNAGGSSIYSEALSIELLSRLLGVHLYKTETELIYNYPNVFDNGGSGPLMDYACHYTSVDNKIMTVGVSVTRAMAFNRNYTKQDAYQLLEKKLKNIIQSSQNIVNTKFDRHILHVWTESGKNASLIKRQCKKLKGHLNFKDTIVLISIVNTNLVFFNNNHLSNKRSVRLFYSFCAGCSFSKRSFNIR